MRLRVALLVSFGVMLVVPAGAAAAFHLTSIREVFPGDTARPTSQYVELQMYAAGQNQVGTHSVTVYNGLGTANSTATFPGPVANGQNQRSILIASPDFAGAFGITPDLEITAPMMDRSGGAVCFDSIDCVSWGSFAGFAGPAPSPVGASAVAIPDGSSLERSIAPGCETLLEAGDDSNDSATDFAAAPPSPRNNSTASTETECDTTVTGAKLSAKSTQRPSPKKPKIVAKATLGEDGGVSVVAKAKLRKQTYKLKKSVSLSAGKQAKVTLKAAGKAKKKIGKALKRGKKVKAKVVATFTDEAGNTAKETAKVTLK